MNIFQLISAIILAFTAHFHVTPPAPAPPAPTPTVTVTVPAPPAPTPTRVSPTVRPSLPPGVGGGRGPGGIGSPVPTGQVYCTYERMLVADCTNGGYVYVTNAAYNAALAQDPNNPGSILSGWYPVAAEEYP